MKKKFLAKTMIALAFYMIATATEKTVQGIALMGFGVSATLAIFSLINIISKEIKGYRRYKKNKEVLKILNKNKKYQLELQIEQNIALLRPLSERINKNLQMGILPTEEERKKEDSYRKRINYLQKKRDLLK